MKVTPFVDRQAWKSPSAVKSAVVVFSLARGMVPTVEPFFPWPPRWGTSALGICPAAT